MRMPFLFIDLENKDVFDPSNYIIFQATKTTSRRIVTNPLKLITIRRQENSFLMRALNLSNYFYRREL